MTNILEAIYNINEFRFFELRNRYLGRNRINNVGDALEYYIKDAFANTFNINDLNERDLILEKKFSWLGNQNNPPDSIIIGCDLLLKISYNYQINNKLEQIETIHSIKKNYLYDSIKFKQITLIEKSILESKHYSEHFTELFKKKPESKNQGEVIINNQENDYIRGEVVENRSSFWMTISSSYSIFILFPFLLFLPIYDSKHRTGVNLVGWLASIILMVGIIFFLTWLAFLIPIIKETIPIYNYVLNFVLHSFLAYILYKFFK